jgi:TetR/AcrR family transcriptional regulator, regulator of cefoperazone and chloramphenicol sensitivity
MSAARHGGRQTPDGNGPSRATPASPTARARRDRGNETRARLIEAAIDVFGRQGYEGATTRQIAKAADANLAAIVYHFGSKEALYLAVAGHLVGEINERMGPVLALVEASFPARPAEAVALLKRMLGAFVDVVLGTPQAERWARFIVREHLDPTEAFDIIYGFTGRAHALATRLVGVALGADADAMETKFRAFTVLGQGIVFRVANAMVLRRIGRDALGPEERDAIKRILVGNIDAMLGGGDAQP